jgi:subtilisin
VSEDFASLPPYRVAIASSLQSRGERIDWGLRAYGVPTLWSKTNGDGVLVAVVDSGVAQHPDLAQSVVDRRNFSGDADATDTLGHGTHVAGVIAANGEMKGIAPGAKLLSLKAIGHSGMGAMVRVAEALNYAVDAECDIVCLSLGATKPDDAVHQAVTRAYAAGVLIVCAAGNDGGKVRYPAAFKEAIGVGAVDHNGQVCDFSARGKEVFVAAPGEDITSTWVNDGYATVSGTSMAAPFVAGVLALYASSVKKDGGKVSQDGARLALEQTCKDAGPEGRDDMYGWGLLDPHSLVHHRATKPAGVYVWIPGGKVVDS